MLTEDMSRNLRDKRPARVTPVDRNGEPYEAFIYDRIFR